MKIGIVQPYFLPYIGYFALINAVDKFVYLDDVQYIRRGWVNRNRIKVADGWHYITMPVKKAPQSASINEVFVVDDEKEIKKVINSIEYSYRKAPYYDQIKDLTFGLIVPGVNISRLNIDLTNRICNYLNYETIFYISSEIKQDNSLKGQDKIINICQILGGDHYINPIGGTELYSKEIFMKCGIKLNFIKMNELVYPQGKGDFIPNLSMIDVLMWNDKESIRNMLNNYTLVEGSV